ncbi:MAG: hypothetical protein RI907_1770 [Pseudomonadota bacterium]|jgi:predicted Fe-S protein YdhL (DUF1289 family)
MSTLPVASPCVRLCTLNDDDVCVGCGRTLDDIKAWQAMPDPERQACVSRAHDRLRALGLPVRQPKVAALPRPQSPRR